MARHRYEKNGGKWYGMKLDGIRWEAVVGRSSIERYVVITGHFERGCLLHSHIKYILPQSTKRSGYDCMHALRDENQGKGETRKTQKGNEKKKTEIKNKSL